MPLKTSEIKVGSCYRTASNQERLVVDIFEDRVRYFSRGGNVKNDWDWGGTKANPAKLSTFADEVDCEIECPEAAPPSGFDLRGYRAIPKTWDLATIGYPFSKNSIATVKVSPETSEIWNGDLLIDSKIPNIPPEKITQVRIVDNVIYMVLVPVAT